MAVCLFFIILIILTFPYLSFTPCLNSQELIEKVMILKKAVERERRLLMDSGSSVLAEKLR